MAKGMVLAIWATVIALANGGPGNSQHREGAGHPFDFSTTSVPSSPVCFNLNELFDVGNGRTNFTGSQTALGHGSAVVDFRIDNTYGYSSSRNYTELRYFQQNNTDSARANGPASRSLQVFSGPNCSTANSSSPSYTWTCQSGDLGNFFDVGYGVASFQIGPAWKIDQYQGHCLTERAAENDAAKNVRTPALVATVLAAGAAFALSAL